MIRKLLIGLMLLVGAPSLTLAASFDCDKAATETEISICADPELSALDELMSSLYQLKYSINLSSEDLSFETDTFDFPAFERSALRDNQLRWIEEIQTNCFGLSTCLTEAYLTRLGDFYGLRKHSRGSKDFGWTIESRLVLSEIGHTVIVWVHNTNETEDYGCFSETYHPISYIITVHRTSDWRLIDYNASLLPHMDDSCLILEYALSELGDHSFVLNTSFMRSAGGWGAQSYNFTYAIKDDVINITEYSQDHWSRSSGESQTISIDFQRNSILIETGNISSDEQPTQETTNFSKIQLPSFNNTSPHYLSVLADTLR